MGVRESSAPGKRALISYTHVRCGGKSNWYAHGLICFVGIEAVGDAKRLRTLHSDNQVKRRLRDVQPVGNMMPATTAKPKNPIDIIEADHLFQTQLCDILERIADDLPDHVDCNLCHTAIHALTVDLPIHHADEEDGLFDLLEKNAQPGDNLNEILAMLSMEHATDESFASEVLESLRGLAEGKEPQNPNMLGYMLRGFFESYRRHLLWENKIVLPLARKRLSEPDLKELSEKMSSHRRRICAIG